MPEMPPKSKVKYCDECGMMLKPPYKRVSTWELDKATKRLRLNKEKVAGKLSFVCDLCWPRSDYMRSYSGISVCSGPSLGSDAAWDASCDYGGFYPTRYRSYEDSRTI